MKKYCMRCMQLIEKGIICSSCGEITPQTQLPHLLLPGTILKDRYLIGNVLGQGGFGITYIGRDLLLDMRVAIKEYYPNGYANRNVFSSANVTVSNAQQAEFMEAGKDKFLREARVLAEFHDEEGIVDVRDYFKENNTAYIVMEYLDGITLLQCLNATHMTPNLIVDMIFPVLDSLEKIHAKQVIHRDISPDNIMLLHSGKLKLMDFGAARQVDFSDQKSISVVLKTGFAPEEQYRPRGEIGPWTDVYALCATIYMCITGERPDNALERAYSDQLKWPSELGIKISVDLENVLKKGMEINWVNRYQNVTELKRALHTVENAPFNDPVSPVPPTPKDPTRDLPEEKPTQEITHSSEEEHNPWGEIESPQEEPDGNEAHKGFPNKAKASIIAVLLVIIAILAVLLYSKLKEDISVDNTTLKTESRDEQFASIEQPVISSRPKSESSNDSDEKLESGEVQPMDNETPQVNEGSTSGITDINDIALPSPTPSITPPDTSNINPKDYQEMMVTGITTTLGLRTSPEKTDNEIGQLKKYSRVNVIERTNDSFWYVYSIDLDAYGYVTAKYLDISVVECTTQTVTLSDQDRSFDIDVPWINLDSDEIWQLNLTIRDEVCSLGAMEMKECLGISYVWYVNGDILSLVIGEALLNKWWDYYVYNISISQRTILSEEDLLASYRYSRDQLIARYKEIVTDHLTQMYTGPVALDPEELAYYIEESTKEENLASAELFANGLGQLCALIPYKLPAGSGESCAVFNLVTGNASNGLDIP